MAKKHLDTKMFKDICKNELKGNTTVKYNCGEYEVEINVKPYSTMQEKQTIAETVWACYGGSECRVATHTPAYRLMVLYTYCDNLRIDLGKGITDYYDLVMHTNLYHLVAAAIDSDDLRELDDIVWAYVHEKASLENTSSIDSALSSLLATLSDKLSSVNVDDLLGDIQKIAKAADDGNIVDVVLDHYKKTLEPTKFGGDTDGENNTRTAGRDNVETV